MREHRVAFEIALRTTAQRSCVLTLLHPLLQCDDPPRFYSIFASIPWSGLHYASATALVATGSGSFAFYLKT